MTKYIEILFYTLANYQHDLTIRMQRAVLVFGITFLHCRVAILYYYDCLGIAKLCFWQFGVFKVFTTMYATLHSLLC